ncbi:hypothetical protein [Streptomyces sp. SAJ15]|uniref:hypothetical protein n=1 Tax=Streptomyces sp. SAJ15 TaxID=2011095 RepID=UPI0021B3C323|nr:hypothetical protein [Streptomyces sp. SAJ15]
MQPLAGADSLPDRPGLGHRHSRPVHWLATAAALGAVIAGAAALQPSDATASPGVVRTASRPVPAPDARTAAYPVDCGPARLDVVDHASADLDGDGRPETVALVRCHSEMGTPPSGIYVLAPAAGGGKAAKPRVVATFLDPKERMSADDFALRGATVSATLRGYSSDQVPRCCPDLERGVNWRWQDGQFVLKPLRVAGSA